MRVIAGAKRDIHSQSNRREKLISLPYPGDWPLTIATNYWSLIGQCCQVAHPILYIRRSHSHHLSPGLHSSLAGLKLTKAS